jgi:hypothetical protein
MPKKGRESPSWARLNLVVTTETSARIDEARGALKRVGVFVSVSQLFEIAVTELLARRDLPEVMRRHGAKARRNRD